MLLVRAAKGPSAIHGCGLFAVEAITRGTRIWKFTRGLDIALTVEQMQSLSPAVRDQILAYAYLDVRTATYVLCGDDARFINHSTTPNIDATQNSCHALCDIAPGEELTENYFAYDGLAAERDDLPRAFYRIPPGELGRPSEPVRSGEGALGKGLFATRDIPAGKRILTFAGTVISVSAADHKGDRRGDPLQIGPNAYIDLKPPGVFLNHSCDPNAGILDDVHLTAIKDILLGEEIRWDYSTTMRNTQWTMECNCGAGSCRHEIGDFFDLPTSLQSRYLQLGIVQNFIAAEARERSSTVDLEDDGYRKAAIDTPLA